MTPEAIIDALAMAPHPEGGWYAEHWRDGPGQADGTGPRGAVSSIYYLLEQGQSSHWHRIDAVEIWHYHAGTPLHLGLSDAGETARWERLGTDVVQGERPQVVIPPHVWQSAVARDGWALVGCTVAPAFVFTGFEMASENWAPGQS